MIDNWRRLAPGSLSLDQVCNTENTSLTSGEMLAGASIDPQTSLMRKIETEKVKGILYQMPEGYRLPILMKDLHDMTYEEVARALGCPLGTVRSRLHRGRRFLRRLYLAQVSPSHRTEKPAFAEV